MKPRLPNEVDREDTPDPPVVDYLNRLRDDLLERLCWDVFGSLNDILIKDPENSLTSFIGASIASESLASPPLSNILVYIDVCEEKHNIDEHEEEDRYAALEPLIIDKEDGSPIFLHDFVSQVHSYLNANKEEIMQCEDELYMNPVDLGDGVKAAEVIPDDDDRDWADGSREDPELSHFLRSGNILEGSRVFFR
ncbi:hypothetical protein COCC4DRAFT_187709 [Bipolaris maydis ATCC 48331]|uniref:Uncharacterized protein n=2 Tax=Cochliobolus heterostrophus TaxID=5016 RepID=M2T2J8_COCH5|nr:uncharacterized protein COCC4DRAFT_187709 [Bipolaris maydis ATCC 48331]EMD91810.1 hypothetical protein COCHEDRAFT_1136814 [Bipolaris maydis C5]KAH7559598.1 hypothetical protein BM1_04535 [Bipolaris maydis]ENI08433.1 hypothetical protein COCC4DRAFT_187709 [Bipolaris maydis ATCC 48331]KAJ5027056.1 hypothetical protein J3E73DRAFT_422760 [Bipolaris maydis]KAJ5059180.1 hypothetical protein J3E74DRAFT_475899 [Bipolaris maydis]